MTLAFVLAAAAAQSSGPPPILAVAQAPMPAVRSRVAADALLPPVVPVTAVPVRIRVTAAGRELFNDTLRVTRNASASYQESRSEAPESVCTGERYYSSQERYSLNINLYLRDETPPGPAVNVSVNWQRPSVNVFCGGEGSRSVQLTQTVPLAPGQSTTIEGDAGLTVTVSR